MPEWMIIGGLPFRILRVPRRVAPATRRADARHRGRDGADRPAAGATVGAPEGFGLRIVL